MLYYKAIQIGEIMEDKKFNNEFEIFNDRGEKIISNALFTFESDETGKNYRYICMCRLSYVF